MFAPLVQLLVSSGPTQSAFFALLELLGFSGNRGESWLEVLDDVRLDTLEDALDLTLGGTGLEALIRVLISSGPTHSGFGSLTVLLEHLDLEEQRDGREDERST
jgi:hypothetical protein